MNNNEFERADLRVDRDIQTDGRSLTVYLEIWFDAGKKFNVDLSGDNTWLNLYAVYDPFADALEMAYMVETDTGSTTKDYVPTENEVKIIKTMITEAIKSEYGQTPQEFCQEAMNENTMEIGGPA